MLRSVQVRSVYDGYVEVYVLYLKFGFFMLRFFWDLMKVFRFFVSLDWQKTIA